jgi:hypothetical protein
MRGMILSSISNSSVEIAEAASAPVLKDVLRRAPATHAAPPEVAPRQGFSAFRGDLKFAFRKSRRTAKLAA